MPDNVIYTRTTLEIWNKIELFARQMRHEPTPAEDALWQQLRRKSMGDYKFRRQHPIDRFIVDFFCKEKRLVIEVDGAAHDYTPEEDALRTLFFQPVMQLIDPLFIVGKARFLCLTHLVQQANIQLVLRNIDPYNDCHVLVPWSDVQQPTLSMQARGFRYRSASSHLEGSDALYLSDKLAASGDSKLHPYPYSNAFSKIQGVGGEDCFLSAAP